MNWTDLAANWNTHLRALAQRFPYADKGALNASKGKQSTVLRVLAQSHDLTIGEAHEELEDFMFLQSLARDTADIRTHDAA